MPPKRRYPTDLTDRQWKLVEALEWLDEVERELATKRERKPRQTS